MAHLEITSTRLAPYRLLLSGSKERGTERVGRLVKLIASNGAEGWGEAAPLPGFSRETIDDVETDWAENAPLLTGRRCPLFDLEVPDETDLLVRSFASPSLRFGVEQALVGLAAAATGQRIAEWIAPESEGRVHVAGLVTDTGASTLESARSLAVEGYRSLKIKVGRQRVDADVDLVTGIRDAVGTEIELRLDANRSWTLREAATFVRQTSDARIAFIEEPLQDPRDIGRLVDVTGASVALDETLLDLSPDALADWSFCTHVIVKPTLLGGIISTESYIAAARDLGMAPVVSSSYESGLGISFLACLSARWCPKGPAAGLGTLSYLASDILRRPLRAGPTLYLQDLSFDLLQGN